MSEASKARPAFPPGAVATPCPLTAPTLARRRRPSSIASFTGTFVRRLGVLAQPVERVIQVPPGHALGIRTIGCRGHLVGHQSHEGPVNECCVATEP